MTKFLLLAILVFSFVESAVSADLTGMSDSEIRSLADNLVLSGRQDISEDEVLLALSMIERGGASAGSGVSILSIGLDDACQSDSALLERLQEVLYKNLSDGAIPALYRSTCLRLLGNINSERAFQFAMTLAISESASGEDKINAASLALSSIDKDFAEETQISLRNIALDLFAADSQVAKEYAVRLTMALDDDSVLSINIQALASGGPRLATAAANVLLSLPMARLENIKDEILKVLDESSINSSLKSSLRNRINDPTPALEEKTLQP